MTLAIETLVDAERLPPAKRTPACVLALRDAPQLVVKPFRSEVEVPQEAPCEMLPEDVDAI